MTTTLQEGSGEGSPVPHPLSFPVPALPGVSICIFAPGKEKENQGLCLSLCSCTITFPIGSSCALNSYLRFGGRGIKYYIIHYVMTVIFSINCFFYFLEFCFFCFLAFRNQKVPEARKRRKKSYFSVGNKLTFI